MGQRLCVVEASVVVACGGLLGDALEALHRRPPFAIKPRRGDFLLFDGSARALVGRRLARRVTSWRSETATTRDDAR